MSSITGFYDIDVRFQYEPTCNYSSHSVFFNWAKEKNINQATSVDPMQNIPENLKNNRINYIYKNIKANIPPYFKHSRAFRCKETKDIWLTYQPTQDKCNIEKEIENWAKSNGLFVTVYDSTMGWFHPGSTCLVVITAKAEICI